MLSYLLIPSIIFKTLLPTGAKHLLHQRVDVHLNSVFNPGPRFYAVWLRPVPVTGPSLGRQLPSSGSFPLSSTGLYSNDQTPFAPEKFTELAPWRPMLRPHCAQLHSLNPSPLSSSIHRPGPCSPLLTEVESRDAADLQPRVAS